MPGNTGATAGICVSSAVGMMPIELLRIIKTELETVLIARFGKFADDIAAERGSVNDVEFVCFGFEESETVVMF